MYNIYSYEKKQKELMKAQKEKVQDEKIKQTRQSKINC